MPDKIIKIAAAVAGFIAGLLGEWDVMLTVLACLIVIDYITGVIVAARGRSDKSETGRLSSKAGFDGLIRKGLICVMVLVTALLDAALGNANHAFRMAAAMYYTANEGLSILENTALMGVPYPAFLLRALETMREKGDGKPPDDPSPSASE